MYAVEPRAGGASESDAQGGAAVPRLRGMSDKANLEQRGRARRDSPIIETSRGGDMDEDLETLSHEQLIASIKALRTAIREHRDSTGHDLCWHHPTMWSLLPEQIAPLIAIPEWPQFMRGCIKYRQSLDQQNADALRIHEEFKE
jgi:hypothetical protein